MSNLMKKLFEGFPYAYGTDEGGCRWSEVTDSLFQRHESGEEMIGIYPMVYDPMEEVSPEGPAAWQMDGGRRFYPTVNPALWKCLWGAIDIDEGDESIVYAENAAIILEALDIKAWVELSRSKGCHVWVFSEDWVEAPIMRKALKAVMQKGDIPYDAVYPKQDSLEGPPGNYMRLPYGGGRPEGRQEALEDGRALTLREFIAAAEANRTPVEYLEAAALLWEPPVTKLPPMREYSKVALMKVDGTRLRGVARRMFDDGPHKYYKGQEGAGKGRHGFLNRFARAMWEAGYEHKDIMSWTKDLDAKLSTWWPEDGPKFIGRQDCDRQIEKVVRAARQQANIR